MTLNPPYFHDGATKTLQDAIGIIAKYQLGTVLSAEDTELIIEKINTLTGEYQGQPL